MNERGSTDKIPRYIKVYEYYKNLILEGNLEQGTRLPSIRKGASQFQISRTTMESAYMQLLAEGYVLSKPQSGYYVTDIAEKIQKQKELSKKIRSKKTVNIRYDFARINVDKDSFRFDLWRRYIKSALRQDDRLLSYGEPQGEYDFRETLSIYLRDTRNVVCTPEQIVVGAGVQSLLHILCPMIKNREKAAFCNYDFIQGRAVFEDYKFQIKREYEDAKGGVYYISPSYTKQNIKSLNTAERIRLIEDAAKKDIMIIEDDYNSEFKYFQKPIPSIQGLAGGRKVVYLGTFSKMLLPSIRMSFMVLPPELLDEYEKRKDRYNQTASKAEQIALTQFIRDGHLAGQIRKSRKIHLEKAEKLKKVAEEIFKNKGEVKSGESGLDVVLKIHTPLLAETIADRAKEKEVAVLPLPSKEEKEACLLLSCTNVATKDYKEALTRIYSCVD